MVPSKWSFGASRSQTWPVPVGQSCCCWGGGEGWGVTHITQRKPQTFLRLSKHLVFIQTLLPFRAAGYCSRKGNSCPINKGWWEGAWGRLWGQMQDASLSLLQLRAAEHQGRAAPCQMWPHLGHPQPCPPHPLHPPHELGLCWGLSLLWALGWGSWAPELLLQQPWRGQTCCSSRWH